MAAEMEIYTDITLEVTGDERMYMVSAKQGDKRTRYVRITLTNDGENVSIPDGYRAIANVKKPDGKYCYNACTKKEGKIIVELTNQMLAVAGTGHCDIELRDENNEHVLSSQAFAIEIEKTNRNENAVQSSNEMTELERQCNEIKTTSDEAVKNAETATKAANTATEKANTATAAANEATKAANTAADGANEAAKSVYTDRNFLLLRNDDGTLTLTYYEQT